MKNKFVGHYRKFTMDHGKLYQDLFEAYKKAMDGKSAREAQEAAISTWNSFKSETEKNKLECLVKEEDC